MSNGINFQKLDEGAAQPIKITGSQASEIVQKQNEYQKQLNAIANKDLKINELNTSGYVKPTEIKKYEYFDKTESNQVNSVNEIVTEVKTGDKKVIIGMCIVLAIILLILLFEIPLLLK